MTQDSVKKQTRIYLETHKPMSWRNFPVKMKKGLFYMICIVLVVVYIKLLVSPTGESWFPFLFLPTLLWLLSFVWQVLSLAQVLKPFVFHLLECAVSPVHVVFHISPTVLGSFIHLRRHVDDCSAHLCGLGPWAFTDGQLAPLREAKVCNLDPTEAEHWKKFQNWRRIVFILFFIKQS